MFKPTLHSIEHMHVRLPDELVDHSILSKNTRNEYLDRHRLTEGIN